MVDDIDPRSPLAEHDMAGAQHWTEPLPPLGWLNITHRHQHLRVGTGVRSLLLTPMGLPMFFFFCFESVI